MSVSTPSLHGTHETLGVHTGVGVSTEVRGSGTGRSVGKCRLRRVESSVGPIRAFCTRGTDRDRYPS